MLFVADVLFRDLPVSGSNPVESRERVPGDRAVARRPPSGAVGSGPTRPGVAQSGRPDSSARHWSAASSEDCGGEQVNPSQR